jgi:hypothetical protein
MFRKNLLTSYSTSTSFMFLKSIPRFTNSVCSTGSLLLLWVHSNTPIVLHALLECWPWLLIDPSLFYRDYSVRKKITVHCVTCLILMYIVTISWCDYIGFTDHLYTPLGTTLYRTLTQLCPQSTTVSINRFLATASTEGDFSASRAQILLSQPSVQNSCQLTTQLTGSHFTPTS